MPLQVSHGCDRFPSTINCNLFPGIGIYWGPGNSYNRSEPLNSRPQTSNRAALVAARCAILDALDYNFTDSLIVRSNNLYLVKTMNEYVHDYVRNGFYRRDGHPAKNPEDIEKLYDCSYRSGINVGYEFRPTHISTRRARELSYDGIWADN